MIIQKKKVSDIKLGDIIIIDVFGIKCSRLDIRFAIENSQFNTEEEFEMFVCGVKEAPIFLFEVTTNDNSDLKFIFGCDYDSETKLPDLIIDKELDEYVFDVIINPFTTIPHYIDTIYGVNPNMTAEGFFEKRD